MNTLTRVGRRLRPSEMERRRGVADREMLAAAVLASAAMGRPLSLTWEEVKAWTATVSPAAR